MNYYTYGSSAIKERVEYQIAIPKRVDIEKNKRKEKINYKKDILICISLILVVFMWLLMGFSKPTEMRIELTKLEQHLHEIKGIRNDKIAEVETAKASSNVIDTATNVLGMNFASDSDVVYITMTPVFEEPKVSVLKEWMNKIATINIFAKSK